MKNYKLKMLSLSALLFLGAMVVSCKNDNSSSESLSSSSLPSEITPEETSSETPSTSEEESSSESTSSSEETSTEVSSESSSSVEENTSSESNSESSSSTEEHICSYEIFEVVQPTCTEKGYTTYKCSCGDTYSAEEVNAINHAYSNYELVSNPTLTTVGKIRQVCQNDNTHVLETEIPVLSDTSVWTATVVEEATCKKAGLVKYASIYGEVELSVPQLEHNQVTTSGKAPTCYSEGVTDSVICDACGDTLQAATTLGIVDHDYVDGSCSYCGVKETTEGFKFTLQNNGTYAVTITEFSSTELKIPAYHNKKPVSTIKANAYYNSNLRTVIIPNTITKIESNAFVNYSYSNLTVYYDMELSGYLKLEVEDTYLSTATSSLYIRNENSVYVNAEEFTDIIIPEDISIIRKDALRNFKGLTSIVFPEGVEAIEDSAMYGLTKLSSIVIPSTVNTIGKDIIYLSGVKQIEYSGTYPEFVENIYEEYGKNLYTNSSNVLPGIKTYRIDGTPEITCFDSVSNVSVNTNVTNLVLTSQGNWKDKYNGSDIRPIENVYYEGTIDKWLEYSFYTAFENPMYSAQNFYCLDGNNEYYILDEVTVPSSITKVGNYAFAGNKNLTSVTLLEGVTTIGSASFYECAKLEEFTASSTLTLIDNLAFNSCTNLKTLSLGSSLETIGSDAFGYCGALTTVTIPSTVTSVGDYAFMCCTNLKTVNLSEKMTTINPFTFTSCTSLSSVTLPSSITTIEGYAFSSCTSLKTLSLNAKIEEIYSYAFEGCTLTTVSYDGYKTAWDAVTVGTNNGNFNTITVTVKTEPLYFIRGNMNNWTGSYETGLEYRRSSNNYDEYFIEITFAAGAEFKIDDEMTNWNSTDYGYSNVESGCRNLVSASTSNNNIKMLSAGTYQIYLKPHTSSIWIQKA